MMGAQSASRARGIGRYALEFTRALVAEPRGHEVLLAVCEDMGGSAEHVRSEFPDLVAQDRIVGYRTLSHVTYEDPADTWRRRAGALLRDAAFAALGADAILESSMFEGYAEDALSSSLRLAKPTVRAVIAYDLIPLRYRDEYLRDPRVANWYDTKAHEFADYDLFLAISEATANDLVALLGIERRRIHTVMAGANHFDYASASPSGEAADRPELPHPYFIYAGSWEPRKNFPALIAAFGQFRRTSGTAYTLVLVTDDTPAATAAIAAAMRGAGLRPEDLIVIGHADDSTLRHLYSDAHALIYPSLYEGFGLPVLEAMVCGTPVLCSRVSSMREIVELDEAMFDPADPEDIARAMTRVSEDYAFRDRLVENGRRRKDAFSWEKTARRAWSALENATAGCVTHSSRREKWARHAELLRELHEIPCEPVGPSSADLAAVSDAIAANLTLYDAAPKTPGGPRKFRVEGPVDSSYSLALINRETARALVRQGTEVSIVSSEGPGDFPPNLAYLEDGYADIKRLLRPDRAESDDRFVVASRNMYPPRVSDMQGDLNILHQYGWEESRFPSSWVDQFNLCLDGITCMSRHVKKVLQDSGVVVPIAVTGVGTDHWLAIRAEHGLSWPGKTFRFLHVSSCFPRKGADALLAAFGRAFRASDDVSLIIKTFANPHNEIEEQLKARRESDPDYPDVHVLFDDLSAERLKSLYMHCHVLVAPSRAEGYGLPLAEALLAGLPVITTDWSGQRDFCREEWCWLIDYRFSPAKTHFDLAASVWVDPLVEDLAAKMREAAATTAEQRAATAARGEAYLRQHHTWGAVARRMLRATESFVRLKRPAPARIGWVTTWNCACGIAAYSAYLINHIANDVTVFGAHDDECTATTEANVRRAWYKYAADDDLRELEQAVLASHVEALVLQFNYGFYNFPRLAAFLGRMAEAGMPVFIVLHATEDPKGRNDRRLALLSDALRSCARVIVHSFHDLNRLKAIGVVGNTCLIPLGVVPGPKISFRPHAADRFVLGSYGFCLPHKGLTQLVEAFGHLAAKDPSLRLELVNAEYPADVSRQAVEEVERRIQSLGLERRVRFTRAFLSDGAAMEKLRGCDLVVFPYRATAESASAAVSFGIASGRPIATTRLPIFDDVAPAVFQIDAATPAVLAAELAGLVALLRAGGESVDAKAAAADRWRTDHSHDRIAAQLIGMIEAVLLDRATENAAELPWESGEPIPALTQAGGR